MCTIGGGIEWHENGFPRSKVSDEAQKLAAELGEVPLFEGRHHWYPISEGYTLCLAASVIDPDNIYTAGREAHFLAPGFVKLGLNIARNMIKYGENPRLNHEVWPPRYQVASARYRMTLAVRTYRGLREKYPDVEPQDQAFDEWVMEGNGLPLPPPKQYVEEFDFGPEHPPKDQWPPDPSFVKESDYIEFNAKDTNEDRKGKVTLARFQGTTNGGEAWYGDQRSEVPNHFVAKVVRCFMHSRGPGMEVEVSGYEGSERLALVAKHKNLFRWLEDEAEYQEVGAAIKANADALANRERQPSNFEFTKFKVSEAGRDMEKTIQADGSILNKVTYKYRLFGKGHDVANLRDKGYSYMPGVEITSDHPQLGEQFEAVGWKMNPHSVTFMFQQGETIYSIEFSHIKPEDGMQVEKLWGYTVNPLLEVVDEVPEDLNPFTVGCEVSR